MSSVIDGISSKSGTDDLYEVLGDKGFNNPKPLNLIKYLLGPCSGDGVILDFFAGSGTTGQAVMELNKEDGGHRQFILVTNNEANGKADAGVLLIAGGVSSPPLLVLFSPPLGVPGAFVRAVLDPVFVRSKFFPAPLADHVFLPNKKDSRSCPELI